MAGLALGYRTVPPGETTSFLGTLSLVKESFHILGFQFCDPPSSVDPIWPATTSTFKAMVLDWTDTCQKAASGSSLWSYRRERHEHVPADICHQPSIDRTAIRDMTAANFDRIRLPCKISINLVADCTSNLAPHV